MSREARVRENRQQYLTDPLAHALTERLTQQLLLAAAKAGGTYKPGWDALRNIVKGWLVDESIYIR